MEKETFSLLYEDGTVIYLECTFEEYENIVDYWGSNNFIIFHVDYNAYSFKGLRVIKHHPKLKEEEQEKPTVTVTPDSVIDADTQEVIEYFEQLGYKPEGVM